MKNVVLKDFKEGNYEVVKRLYIHATEGYKAFPIFAVYEHPKECKDKYVVRMWQIIRGVPTPVPTQYCLVKDTLEECRDALPAGLFRFKDANADPVIVETWI